MNIKHLPGYAVAAAAFVTVAMVPPNSVNSSSVVNNSLTEHDFTPFTRDKLNERAAVLAEKVTIVNIGGPIAGEGRATKVPMQLTMQPGKYLMRLSGAFQRNTAAADGDPAIRPQVSIWLDLNGDDSYDWQIGEQGGNISPNVLIPTRTGRHMSFSGETFVVISDPTVVQVAAFGYADDGGTAGSGQIDLVAATLTSTRVA
jgi:hypothetical protein